MEVAPDYTGIGDDAMHDVLLGRSPHNPQFVTDVLKHPESAWIVDVPIPDDEALYGPASGQSLPVASFIVYPSNQSEQAAPYKFPYFDGQFGTFEDMLAPGEVPSFADPDARYPLILITHGSSAHGIYDVAHAQGLARHGYIVAVLTYGDDRTAIARQPNEHLSFLRPLLTKAVLDSLLESDTFGPHIDADNIGITGFSFGGFTALAIAGGPYQGNPATVSDPRITAGVIAAPWVGHRNGFRKVFAFGPDNKDLDQVSIPILCLFGTKDEATTAATILPAMKNLSGPTYVVELVDQPHVFEDGSWQDRNNWEQVFFAAYLKHDPAALEILKTADSMKGGNVDLQRFEYQK